MFSRFDHFLFLLAQLIWVFRLTLGLPQATAFFI
jgi:hypothetical protein